MLNDCEQTVEKTIKIRLTQTELILARGYSIKWSVLGNMVHDYRYASGNTWRQRFIYDVKWSYF